MPVTLTGSIWVSSAYRAGDGMFRVKLSKAKRRQEGQRSR